MLVSLARPTGMAEAKRSTMYIHIKYVPTKTSKRSRGDTSKGRKRHRKEKEKKAETKTDRMRVRHFMLGQDGWVGLLPLLLHLHIMGGDVVSPKAQSVVRETSPIKSDRHERERILETSWARLV